MEYFSSDWHLSHYNILKYSNRPFENTEDMDAAIFFKASSVLKRGDLLYYLGDLSFNKIMVNKFFDLMDNLGVQVHFIFGNHDKDRRIISQRAVWSGEQKSIKIRNQDITLNHYAMRVWNKSHFNAWNLHGHSHGGLEPVGKQLDVGVDKNNFYIWSFDEVCAYMKNQPDNFNYIPEGSRR